MSRASTFYNLRPVFSRMPPKKESERHSARVFMPLTRTVCHGATIFAALVRVGGMWGVQIYARRRDPLVFVFIKKNSGKRGTTQDTVTKRHKTCHD